MKVQNQWKRLAIGGVAALTLTAGTFWAVDNVSAASPTTNWVSAVQQQVMGFAGRGDHHGQDGMGGPGSKGRSGGALMGEQQQYLADALGITLEQLQTAHETVRTTAIDQAVADGTITQEQADQLKAGERLRLPGLHLKGGPGKAAGVDHEALLANALGITVEELDTAQAAARDTALAAALADGTVTQEQVDRMTARQALQEYVHTQYPDARPEVTMPVLIQEAVTAGAITQAQADLLLSSDGRMGPGGRGELRGRGPRSQDDTNQPDAQPNSSGDVPEGSTDSNT